MRIVRVGGVAHAGWRWARFIVVMLRRERAARRGRAGGRSCMWSGFPLFPEQASTMAGRVDALYFFLIALTRSSRC